jgi:uncharacterized protein DUF6268
MIFNPKVPFAFLLITLLACTRGQDCWAQLGASSLNGPGMAFSVDYLPPSHYIRPSDSLKTKATTSQVRYNFGASFSLGSKIDTVTHKVRTWSLSAMGSYTRLTNEKYDNTIFPSELLATDLALQHYRSLNNHWGMVAMLSVGVYSDMGKINGDDVFINGGVIFVKQQNKHFSYGFGAGLTNAFGVPMILPAFLIKWQTDSKIRIDINFPEKIGIAYTLNKQDDLALSFRLRGAAYNLQNRPDSNRLMAYREFSLGLENTWHLSKKVDFITSGGSILYSGVDFREKSLSDMFKTKPFHRLEANYYLSAGLRWNFQSRK